MARSGMITGGLACALVLLLPACEPEQTEAAPTYASAADQLTAEYGGGTVGRTAIDQVLEISKRMTLDTRSEGIQKLVTAAKNVFGDVQALNEIEDFTIGQPLPGVGEYVADPRGPVKSSQHALEDENPNDEHKTCPPMNLTGSRSCYQIIELVKKQVLAGVDLDEIYKKAADMIEQDPTASSQPADFKSGVTNYVGDLGVRTQSFGIGIAALRAEFALRAAGLCDDEVVDGPEIARLRGIEESIIVLRELVGLASFEIRPEGGECLQIGRAGAVAEMRIKQQIKTYVEKMKQDNERKFCLDMSANNPNVVKAYEAFTEGLEHGIQAHVATIWVGTLRNGKKWSGAQFMVANIDGCQPKDQIKYTTSPLVIDLAGDGLTLSTDRVGFDLRATGEPQRVTWAGDGEGFLALDLDGDGQITSGRELFGDRTTCGSERCADGAAALARHDDPARGGDGNGRIDARDAVFSALKVWVDRNRDGRSQPEELGSLDAHGIRALSLAPTYVDEELPGGKISLTLTVETDSGLRTAYDVWFDNVAGPGLPTPLF